MVRRPNSTSRAVCESELMGLFEEKDNGTTKEHDELSELERARCRVKYIAT